MEYLISYMQNLNDLSLRIFRYGMNNCVAWDGNIDCRQIMISTDMFDETQQEWVPLDDPVFQLTPTSFHNQANDHYTALGRPAISRGTFWDIYTLLLACFRQGHVDVTSIEEQFSLANFGANRDMDLLPGLREMRIGGEVVGDGVALQEENFEADFTEDEEVEGTYAADFTDNEA
jgi:hypothetical protein